MNGVDWSRYEDETMIDLRRKGYKISKMAELLHRTPASVKNRIFSLGLPKSEPVVTGRTLKVNGEGIDVHISKKLQNACNSIPRFNKYYKICSKDTMIVSDLHLPFLHLKMWENAKMVARFKNIKTLIIAGDLTNQDAFSKYINEGSRGSFEKEMDIIDMFFKDCLSLFDNIYMIAGNHDMRFIKTVQAEIKSPRFFKMFTDQIDKRVFINGNYGYMELNKGWHITHPKNYSRTCTAVARQNAMIYQKHIASGHGHHQGWGFDVGGKNVGCDIGCMCDARKIPYVSVVDSTNPRWNYGFMTIENYEFPYWYNFYITDWSLYQNPKISKSRGLKL